MVNTSRAVLVALPTLLLALGCSQGEAPKGAAAPEIPYPAPTVNPTGEPVAKLGDVTFTTAEFETRLQQVTPFRRVMLADKEKKREFVENELRMELLAQEGWRRGLHQDPKIVAQLKRLIVTQVMNDELQKLEGDLNVTDADLMRSYKERFDEFNKPEKVRVAQIVRYVQTDKERAQAKRMLQKVERDVLAAERKNDPRAFSRLAKQHSEDEATNNGGGDLNFLTRDELSERYGDEVTKFLFDEVKVGDMAIADAPNAVVLFKKTGRRRGVQRTLEMVKPQVRGQVIAERRKELFDAVVAKLMKERGVTVNWELVDGIVVDTGGAPSGIPSKPARPGTPSAPTKAPAPNK